MRKEKRALEMKQFGRRVVGGGWKFLGKLGRES